MDKRMYHDYPKYYYNLVKIGSGALKIIYKRREKKINELRAIKVIQFDKLKENIISYKNEKKLKECIDEDTNEYENMKILYNLNSVKYFEYSEYETNFVIIMEFSDSNSFQLLAKNKDGLNVIEIYEILKQLNNVFKIMKENEIIHRDLKLKNILIKYDDNNKYLIKLLGYGINKKLNSLSKNHCNLNIRKKIYITPEVLTGENYNYKCDLWSIGVIMNRLKFIKLLFKRQKENGLIQKINNFNNNIIKKTENDDLDDLFRKLLGKNYIKRLNWYKYYNQPFSNKINLIYFKKKNKDIWDRDNNIFGYIFVENNKNNIQLIINGMKIQLVQKYELKYGENEIEIIIKNKISNFEHMFYDCISLKNIEGLKYLDVSNGKNFSGMFHCCNSLIDIKPLKNWNVSNGYNFSRMFFGCKSLSDINSLKNWNVSNGNNFSSMFNGCKSLYNIKALENWNVSNGKYFSSMFFGCNSLSDIKSFENWNVLNGNIFSEMFKKTESLSDIKPLEKLNTLNENNFSELLHKYLSKY